MQKCKNNHKFFISSQLFNFAIIQKKIMYKKITLFFSLLSIIFSCQNNSNNFIIKGSTDLENGSKIYHIVADQNNQPKTLDTLDVNEGVFELNSDISEPNIHFLQIEDKQGTFPFIAEIGTIKIEVFKDSFGVSKASGTISNNDFMKYKSETKVYIESLNGIGNDLQQAMILKDSLLIEDLQEQYQDVRDQIQNYELDFIKGSPNSLISVLILERFVSNKIIPIDEAKVIFKVLTDRVKNTSSGRIIKQQIELTESAEVGDIAPAFEGPDPKGSKFRLKDSLGKITIIDFWASWCRPCRIENPNLVELYQKNKNRGLNIIGVSLDQDKGKWLKAIEDDGLIWNHVSNLKFWNEPIAKLYKVTAIPATFILNEKGVIVARNLRGIALYNKVEELLNKI